MFYCLIFKPDQRFPSYSGQMGGGGWMGRRSFFCRIDCESHLFTQNHLLTYPFTENTNFGLNAPFFIVEKHVRRLIHYCTS